MPEYDAAREEEPAARWRRTRRPSSVRRAAMTCGRPPPAGAASAGWSSTGPPRRRATSPGPTAVRSAGLRAFVKTVWAVTIRRPVDPPRAGPASAHAGRESLPVVERRLHRGGPWHLGCGASRRAWNRLHRRAADVLRKHVAIRISAGSLRPVVRRCDAFAGHAPVPARSGRVPDRHWSLDGPPPRIPAAAPQACGGIGHLRAGPARLAAARLDFLRGRVRHSTARAGMPGEFPYRAAGTLFMCVAGVAMAIGLGEPPPIRRVAYPSPSRGGHPLCRGLG